LSALSTRVFGFGISAALVAFFVWIYRQDWNPQLWLWLCILVALLGWIPWLIQMGGHHLRARGVARNVRVLKRDASSLRRLFMRMAPRDLHGQPLPDKRRTDDRYELLSKFQGVLKALDYTGIAVL